MHLYLMSDRNLEETAHSIVEFALPSYECQLRDGLNLGGGEYFKFFANESEVLLVCNDEDHMEVFVEERASFPFYCYARKGEHGILEAMFSSLKAAGFECELGNEDA
jgi:hypothetical protein